MAPSAPPPGPRRASLGVLLVGAVLVSACSGPNFQYIHDHETQTFLRLPNAWKTFDQQTLLGTSPVPNPFQQQGNPVQFLEAFTADANEQPANFPQPTAAKPQGFVLVRQLSPPEQDSVSLGAIRNAFVPIDQMMQQDPNSVAVFSYDPNLQVGSFRGSHIVFSVRSSPDAAHPYTQSYTVNQTGMLDPGLERMYLLVLMCSSSCYKDNQSTIEQIANSWKVENAL
jgi:hypothetical protein